MKNFFFANFFWIIFVAILLVGCQNSDSPESEMSNSVRLGESSFVVLSEFFARELAAFDFEFGDFAPTKNFLGVPADAARVEILRGGAPILIVSEVRFSADFSFENLLEKLADRDLHSAIFGENSYYFIDKNSATNFFPLADSALAFEFDSQNFPAVRDFISAFLILR